MRIPNGQVLWETFRDEGGRILYAVTSDVYRRKYTLFRADGKKTEKVAQADSPLKLYPLMDRRQENGRAVPRKKITQN